MATDIPRTSKIRKICLCSNQLPCFHHLPSPGAIALAWQNWSWSLKPTWDVMTRTTAFFEEVPLWYSMLSIDGSTSFSDIDATESECLSFAPFHLKVRRILGTLGHPISLWGRNDQECVQMSSLNLLDPSVLTPLLWGLHQNCANRCGSRCLSGTCRNQRHTFQVRFVGCVRHIQLNGSRSCRIPFQAKHLAICKFLAENQHLRMDTHEQHQPLKSFVCNCMRFWLCTCSQKRFLIMFVSQPCPTAMCPDVHQHLHPPDHSPNSEAFLFLKETAKTQYRSAPCHHVLFYKKRMKSQP